MRIPVGWLLAGWIVVGVALAVLGAIAWSQPAAVRSTLAALQGAYGTQGDPPWPLRADTHVHILTMLCLASWLGLGCRLFAPRGLPWLAIGAAMLIGVADELAQLGSVSRSFEWGDQAADAVGLLLALPVLLWIRGWRLAPPAAAQRTKS